MRAFRLAGNELRRLTATKMSRLAVFSICIIPLIYGALYLYTNWDPYGKLKNVPAAIVLADKGVVDVDGSKVNFGDKVGKQLMSRETFAWKVVSAAEADKGVRNGDYGFSLTVPPDFSGALSSMGTAAPRRAQLVLTTNDSNNYLIGTIAGSVTNELKTAVAVEAGTTAANRMMLGFGEIFDKTKAASDGAGKLAGGAEELATGADQLRDGSAQLDQGTLGLANGNRELADGLATMQDKTKELPDKTKQLADGAQQVANANQKLADLTNPVALAANQLIEAMRQTHANMQSQGVMGIPNQVLGNVAGMMDPVNSPVAQANRNFQAKMNPLQKLANGSQQVADGAKKLSEAAPQLTDGINKAADGSKKLADGSAKAHDGAAKLHGGLIQAAGGAGQLRDGATALSTGLNDGRKGIPHPTEAERKKAAETIGEPVGIQKLTQAKATSYGAGLAPFFIGIALWAGAFTVFMLIKPLSQRALARSVKPVITALGGWLPAAAIGIVQSVLLFGILTIALGLKFEYPILAWLFMALTSITFLAVMQGMIALLGATGRYLVLILMITQLISSGGTMPWQTIPELLHPLHYILPMSYVIDGLRHLLYGPDLSRLPQDVGMVLLYLLLGVGLSTLAAHKQRIWSAARLKPDFTTATA
ncbi:YhgE/Pip domain-containing protein [Pseudonocardiaceae bacterium YIM PH 21723]|nr:YhgE/Pip domain-containing protein [Pseudonocardiaceae bacterium YIM PH 21723]